MKLTSKVLIIVLAIGLMISTSVVFAGELEAKGDKILDDCCKSLTSCGVSMEDLSGEMTSEVKPIIDEAKACIKECKKKIAIAEIDKDEAVIADAKACITKCENAIKGCTKVKTTAGSLDKRGKLLKELASEGPETFMNKIAAKTKKAAGKVKLKKKK
ncbi:hypothetical protein KKC91_07945 [bacterium]|nr:hypothetical protein [bacterium]